MSEIKEDFGELFARLEDLCRMAERGAVAKSGFLSPKEGMLAERFLQKCGAEYFSFGGYCDAERIRMYILPDYASGVKSVAALEEFGESCEICALEIVGSGFEKLTHRAVMGTVLGLGIERDVVGDIIVLTDSQAVVFCEERISEFLLCTLCRVGRDKVLVRRAGTDVLLSYERKFQAISDTVASPRLDAVVAALCSLSRERAKQVIASGSVELDCMAEERGDRELIAPCVLSVRGYGKFKIVSLSERTKKGRIRLSAEKFI